MNISVIILSSDLYYKKDFTSFLKLKLNLFKYFNIILWEDKSITINKSYVKLGVWVKDRIIPCTTRHAYIYWNISNWKLVDSPFDISQKFLVIWNIFVLFTLKELEIDEDWDKKEQEWYSEIFKQYLDDIPDAGSLLFIIPINKISIPENADDVEYGLNISVNDYRTIYSIFWSQLEVSKELEDYIDEISDNSYLEVTAIGSISLSNLNRLSYRTKFITDKMFKKNATLCVNIWKKLLSK